jgi:hypothetical protein
MQTLYEPTGKSAKNRQTLQHIIRTVVIHLQDNMADHHLMGLALRLLLDLGYGVDACFEWDSITACRLLRSRIFSNFSTNPTRLFGTPKVDCKDTRDS